MNSSVGQDKLHVKQSVVTFSEVKMLLTIFTFHTSTYSFKNFVFGTVVISKVFKMTYKNTFFLF